MVLRSSFKNENVANFMLVNLSAPEFPDSVPKLFYDVKKKTWILCCHMATVGNKGLN